MNYPYFIWQFEAEDYSTTWNACDYIDGGALWQLSNNVVMIYAGEGQVSKIVPGDCVNNSPLYYERGYIKCPDPNCESCSYIQPIACAKCKNANYLDLTTATCSTACSGVVFDGVC